ncbi:inositol monophosphatase [Patescibacteria group bacterium AH-259-L05]|nr:inositol monophosphatase [Patescibacteria group bacterium AH-259-L05]
MRQFITQLSKDAGKILLRYFRKDKSLVKLRKSVKGITTKYDIMVDRFIIREITKKYPKHNLVTEETGAIDKRSEYTWIVDSLDGTTNYAYGNPLFSLCIALIKGDELLLGTVYAPAIDGFYIAEKGKGAYFNNQKVYVSDIGDLKKSYVFLCDGGEINRKRSAKIVFDLYHKVTDARKLGSAGIECAWIAAGRADAYVTTKIRPWDVASGVLLVEEAGGMVTDFKGKPWDWKKKQSDLIFSNKKVHSQVQKIVKDL